MALTVGWRMSFVILGALGFVWLVRAQEMNRRNGMRMVDEGGKG